MTNSEAASRAEWHKEEAVSFYNNTRIVDGWEVRELSKDRLEDSFVAFCATEARADAIIADHNNHTANRCKQCGRTREENGVRACVVGGQRFSNHSWEFDESNNHTALATLLDELEPAWHEAYSDPLNLVRVLQAKAQEATDVFHERQQREAVEAERDRLKEQRFPIMGGPSIPWRWLLPHEAQAKKNHGGQDLVTLYNRGGLSSYEALRVLEDLPLTKGGHWPDKGDDRAARDELQRRLDAEDSLTTLTAKLLALAVEQRRALDYIRKGTAQTNIYEAATAALATDLDALVAEASELGIEVPS